MRAFDILADASCDLTEEIRKRYDIRIIPGHLRLPDQTEVLATPGWDLFTREEFYADLKKHPNDYSTSPANVEEFAKAFEESAAAGHDVLVLTISSGISGAFNFALQAKNQVMEAHPEMTICCVDSLRFGPGHGLMTVRAAELRA